MSKTKFALLIFCVAFGVNILAFVFSKKTFLVEESKSVWLYELPLTASPLDSYVALDVGPHQGVIGTLFMPNFSKSETALEPLLASRWRWNDQEKMLDVELKPSITFHRVEEPILPLHFIQAHEWIKGLNVNMSSPEWTAWMNANLQAAENGHLRFYFSKLPSDFDLERFLAQVLTHPLSGPIHPKNLAALKAGEPVTKGWISSGPYFIRKWRPKEIELGSREKFPVGMQNGFFRVLKFQSAPVKNPSCDFMQARAGDEASLPDHTVQPTRSESYIFWVCRSYRDEGVCKNPEARTALSMILSGSKVADRALKGVKVRYRIPFGSDDFRQKIRGKIEKDVRVAGGEVEETSFFFQNSNATDLELEFVSVPAGKNSTDFATSLALLSSRLGPDAVVQKHLVGVLEHFPQVILMKRMKGEVFPKVFLEPDLDEKKLPL